MTPAAKKESTTLTQDQIAEIIKLQREFNKKSQRDVAKLMGYTNANFISMLEHGASKPPVGKLKELCNAVDIDSKFAAVIMRNEYPEAWQTLKFIVSDLTFKSVDDLENQIDKYTDKLKKEFGI